MIFLILKKRLFIYRDWFYGLVCPNFFAYCNSQGHVYCLEL